MNILVFIPSKTHSGPIMELLAELGAMGHNAIKWELALQWSQESAFPEKKLEVKKVWTHRLKALVETSKIDLTVSEAATALESFQIISTGPKTESQLLAIPVRHCLLWLNSPCGWNAGRATLLAAQKIFEADNLFHIACTPDIAWELENILAVPAERIIAAPMPAAAPQQPQAKTKDLVFLSKAQIPQDLAPLVASARESNAQTTLSATAVFMRRMFAALCRNMLPSVQEDFANFYDEYLQTVQKAPFTDLSAFMAKKGGSIQNLLYYFQLCPERFAQLLNIEETLRTALSALTITALGKKPIVLLSAPPAWHQAGFATDDNVQYQAASGLLGSARVCVCLPHKVSLTPLGHHLAMALASPTAAICPDSDPCLSFFKADRDLCTAGQPEDFAHAAQILLADEDKRARIMQSGISSVKSSHTWNNCLSRMFKKWT